MTVRKWVACQPSNDFCDQCFAAKETVGIFFIEILQSLKRRLAGFGRQILKVFDFGIADNGGFDINHCAAKITGEFIAVSGRCAAVFCARPSDEGAFLGESDLSVITRLFNLN